MPIPLLFIAAGVGTGLLGIGKGIIAGAEQHEASETNRAATRIAEEAKALIEGSRKNCKDALDSLGNRKVSILNDSIKTFVTEFEKINHIELSESKGLKELQNLVIDKKSFSDLKELQGMASSLVGGVASGAVAGALTCFLWRWITCRRRLRNGRGDNGVRGVGSWTCISNTWLCCWSKSI